MKKNKLVFLDIDGTLIDYESQIPESAVEAIKKARKNGNKIYLSTGRSKPKIPLDKWNIEVDGIIAANGSYIEDNGEVVFNETFDIDQLKEIIDWLDSKHLAYFVEGNSQNIASLNFEERAKKTSKEYIKITDPEKLKNLTVRKLFPEMIFDGDVIKDDILKINFILDSYDDYLEAVEKFPEFKVGTWGGKGEKALFGDITLPNISKDRAIKKLIEFKKENIEDTIAFGDAKIDIPMLEVCNVGVAMGNGGKEIKEIADFITDNVEDDGLYKAFEKLKLI